MPIYSYHCDACDHEFELREGFDAPTVRDCACGQERTARRIIHPVGVIYKGSGFYTTDYARKGSNGSNNTSSGGAASSSGSSDSTPAASTSGSDKASSDKPSNDS